MGKAQSRIQTEFLRKEYIQSQESLLQKEVTNVVSYIHDMREQAEHRLEVSLQERIYGAHQIAMNIYQENMGSKDIPEIQKMIKDALRPIRFNGGRGYYFAVSMDGYTGSGPGPGPGPGSGLFLDKAHFNSNSKIS